jgi:hypothetical protein
MRAPALFDIVLSVCCAMHNHATATAFINASETDHSLRKYEDFMRT